MNAVTGEMYYTHEEVNAALLTRRENRPELNREQASKGCHA